MEIFCFRFGHLLQCIAMGEMQARLEEETVEEEDEQKKKESLDHQVEEVEPLELPPAGHLRVRRVPEDKIPDPLQVTSRLSHVTNLEI